MAHEGFHANSSAVENNSTKSSKGARGWIDISVPLHNAMVHWPGDPSSESNVYWI